MATPVLPKLQQALPAPLQRVLGSTGLNVVAGEPHQGAMGLPAIASVDGDSVNTIQVEDPRRFVSGGAQTLGHEATHLWQNNLPPTIAAKIPQDRTDPYAFSEGALPSMRAAGKTLTNLPRELGATIMQKYIADGGEHAPESVQKLYKPWLQDMQSAPLSTIIPTQPGQKGISTTPRPPLPVF